MRVANFFNEYAKDFAAIYGNRNGILEKFVNALFRQSMRLRYERTLAACAPVSGRTVLDVGCGPGHYSIALAKMGANVHGIDVAGEMIDIARMRAAEERVDGHCTFDIADFRAVEQQTYDFVILMGFMDYVSDSADVCRKALSMARMGAFFSFPLDGGFLAWQRKLRYLRRCELFMYTEERVRELFVGTDHSIEKISRDLFVAVHV